MALTRRAGSPYYYSEFMIAGKRYVKSTKTTNRQLAMRIEHEYRNTILKQTVLGERKPATLLQVLTLTAHSKQTLAKSTKDLADIFTRKLTKQKLKKYRTARNCFGFAPDLPFDKLTTYDIHQLITHRRAEGVSEQTIIHELTFIRQALRVAKRLDFVVPNIDIADIMKTANVRVPKHKIAFLTPQQQMALIEAITDTDTHDLCCLLLDTGARWSEIANLKWSDVQTDKITIHRTKVKNAATLSMTRRTQEILSKRERNSQWVFPSVLDNEKPLRYDGRYLKQACKKIGIQPITFHTLRHTAASTLAQRGATIQEIQVLLGHSTVQTTLKYSHLVENKTLERMATLLEPA